jgi:hypothetical protein
MEPGRRAFLLPSGGARDPWAQFQHRLARVVAGSLTDETTGSLRRARLRAARPPDLYHARALCAELGVVLADANAGIDDRGDPRPWLWVDAGSLAGHGAVDTSIGLIGADAGCRIGSLSAALSGTGWHAPALRAADPAETLGRWFATADGWLPGRCDASGVHAVDVMLADGSSQQLGSFGVAGVRPLTPALRALVSGLFEFAGSPAVTALRGAPRWPARYRLDALLPETPAGATPVPNLAHLLLGSRGSLAWVERIHLRLQHDAASPAPTVASTVTSLPGQPPALAAVQHIDAEVKRRFDPATCFPSPFV